MVKQFYNSGNKCFMLINTDKKGGIIKASKTPYNDYPIENIEIYMEEGLNEKAVEMARKDKVDVPGISEWDEEEVETDPGKDKSKADSKDSDWDDFFG